MGGICGFVLSLMVPTGEFVIGLIVGDAIAMKSDREAKAVIGGFPVGMALGVGLAIIGLIDGTLSTGSYWIAGIIVIAGFVGALIGGFLAVFERDLTN